MITFGGELSAVLLHGAFLDGLTDGYPVTVLGYGAAQTLGIIDLSGTPRVWLGGRWFAVIGILAPFELAPEVDRSALIGLPVAARDFGYDGHPTRIYVRADTDRTEEVAGDARPCRQPSSSTALFLGLGAVALLVGGIGIGNVMVISVLERPASPRGRSAHHLAGARSRLAGQAGARARLAGQAGAR
jgi:putative ABC transport system permease protein